MCYGGEVWVLGFGFKKDLQCSSIVLCRVGLGMLGWRFCVPYFYHLISSFRLDTDCSWNYPSTGLPIWYALSLRQSPDPSLCSVFVLFVDTL